VVHSQLSHNGILMDGGLLVLGCLGHIIHMVVLYIPTYIGKILDTM
jgi:hypothetical protein